MTGNKCYLSPIDTNDVEWFNDLKIVENLTFYSKIINIEIKNIEIKVMVLKH
jgi:hypothetical protein